MPRSGPKIVLTPALRALLEEFAASRTLAHRLVERARIVLAAADGESGNIIAERLDCDQQRVWRWRRRWASSQARLGEAESAGATGNDLRSLVRELLGDRARSGAPPTFSSETVAQLVALACELPADCGLPFSHWTPDALAEEAIKRGIVTSISARHLDRLLKRSRTSSAQDALLDDVEGQARES